MAAGCRADNVAALMMLHGGSLRCKANPYAQRAPQLALWVVCSVQDPFGDPSQASLTCLANKPVTIPDEAAIMGTEGKEIFRCTWILWGLVLVFRYMWVLQCTVATHRCKVRQPSVGRRARTCSTGHYLH